MSYLIQQKKRMVSWGFCVFLCSCGAAPELDALRPLASAGGPSAQGHTLDHSVPGNHYQDARLGMGFDSYSKNFLPLACVAGESTAVGSTAAEMSYSEDLDQDQLTRVLSASLGWSPTFAALAGDLEFVKSSAASKLSNTHTVFLNMQAHTQSLLNESLVLTPAAEGLSAATTQEVMQACGNEYVSAVKYGGALMVTLRFDFATEQEKSEFNAGSGARFDADLGEIVIPMAGRLKERLKRRTQISVVARQFGGDPAALIRVLPEGMGSCTLQDPGPCSQLFQNLVRYAQGDFQNQFTEPSDYVPVSYETRHYRTVAGLSTMLSWMEERPASHLALRKWGRLVEEQQVLSLMARRLAAEFSHLMNRRHFAELLDLQARVDDDVHMLKQRFRACHLDATTCDSALPRELTDDAWLRQPLFEAKVVEDFTESPALEHMRVLSSRGNRLQVEHRSAAGELSFLLPPRSALGCGRTDHIEVGVPVRVDQSGEFRLEAGFLVRNCENCEVKLLVGVNDQALRLEGYENQEELSLDFDLNPGHHVVQLHLSGKGICREQNLGLTLRRVSLRRVVHPFEGGASEEQ